MPARRYYFVYILASRIRTAIYTGVTRDLRRRVAQHRAGLGGQFTRRYSVNCLVWYETHEDPVAAIAREKQLKAGPRRRKIALIERHNPNWTDLWDEI
ncbi:MAG: GIY-YIG nuclease family protein [Gemmatimonadota bacterium]